MGLKLFCCALALTTGTAMGQAIQTQAEMHARVAALYNFSPHTLDDAGRAAKSAEMDKFWGAVKADPAHMLPLLRTELLTTSNPRFFMEDGSELLTSLSKDPGDMQIAADAHALTDLADVQPAAYFYWVHQASMQGIDTTRAALHILDDPKFAVPVPRHAMMLNQAMSLVYLLIPVDSAKWMDAARARFKAEKSEPAQLALLELFFYAQTKDGDAALETTAHDPGVSENIRKAALQHQQDVKNVLASKHAVKGTEASIREARKKRLAAVSDEAIDDVQDMTAELMIVRSRP
jgi:hypothetical protein